MDSYRITDQAISLQTNGIPIQFESNGNSLLRDWNFQLLAHNLLILLKINVFLSRILLYLQCHSVRLRYQRNGFVQTVLYLHLEP